MNTKHWLLGSELYTDEEWKRPWVLFLCWLETITMVAALVAAAYCYIFKVGI
jgi:hypothetical protein